ncbi:NAD(P)-dependent oxidoreductase [Wenxinia marina]|uniref:3-hydroxyisobutyrate dehydrogenase n=1 Tax=Wenxinia marina DSM 24838 TaxID=1123501 RepID=A0A0D0NNK7_9RHOB|nr:NAD(P)-dependent oxidoreductase [Wenxinia marina]KIQ69840.1 3-hydroxyisobutyrate dehydrogenase [Wenxinia marina DSM 24838]GGL61643.1 6-phosphogluconate dehydrogenase [Wenxinia marina]
MKLAFIGFGEAGRAFANSLQRSGSTVTAAYDLKDTDEMAEAMASRGIRRAAAPADAVRDADWIVSAVTADQSLAAAEGVAPHLVRGQVFVDINSVAPGRKRATAALIEGAGARYLDMAVMAPVHPRGHATPVLIAGREAQALLPALLSAGFAADVAGEAPGEATAIKMVRSLFVKGLEAITTEALIAASASGCHDRVLASLSESYPALGWPDIAAYQAERMLKHGARRAAEMRESAATLDDLGLNGALAAAIAASHDAMGALPLDDLPEGPLAEGFARLAALRTGRG